MSSFIYDNFSKLTPEKAKKTRESLESELYSNRNRLIVVKNRRHKILKKLDKEIADIEEQISMLKNTIKMIDKCHFNTPDLSISEEDVLWGTGDISDADFDEVY